MKYSPKSLRAKNSSEPFPKSQHNDTAGARKVFDTRALSAWPAIAIEINLPGRLYKLKTARRRTAEHPGADAIKPPAVQPGTACFPRKRWRLIYFISLTLACPTSEDRTMSGVPPRSSRSPDSESVIRLRCHCY